jgi:hypothetical protein
VQGKSGLEKLIRRLADPAYFLEHNNLVVRELTKKFPLSIFTSERLEAIYTSVIQKFA